MKNRTTSIQEFLEWYRPGGPWDLAAIIPDSDLKGRRFSSDDNQLANWIEPKIGKENIYFHVNRLHVDVKGKARREDVSSLDWLHVDIDPRIGEDLGREQTRTLALLTNTPDVPEPSLVIMSGGGYQGFWRLERPIDLSGNLQEAINAARWNKHLETIFGGDNCHNVDRLMRLPFTVNVPDNKKKRKGRQIAETYVEFNNALVYNLSDFKANPKVDEGQTQSSQVVISSNVKRLNNVDDLDGLCEYEIPGWLKVLIVQGKDPLRPERWPSRSEALYACVCELARCGALADTIYSVITDPDFEISSSVIEKGSSQDRYARRQIEKAMDEAVDPHLADMNTRHAIVENIAGKCRVIEMIPDFTGQGETLTTISFADIVNRYMNVSVQAGTREDGSPIRKEKGKWWLKHPRRRSYHTIIFSPGAERENCFNLWRGFKVEAKPGDCEIFITHIREVICGGNLSLCEYVLSWMARAVQYPANPGETALVLRGKMGVGKGAFARIFGNLFGSHFLHITDPKHLIGAFNHHLKTCVVLFADEAFFAADHRQADKLQTLITEPTFMTEQKHYDAQMASNFVHLIMASNRDWVIPAGPEERRYVVLDVLDDRIQDHGHFGKMSSVMASGGSSALLYFLLHRDISTFNVRAVPKTAGLQDQKIMSFSSEEEWWYQFLCTGTIQDQEWSEPIRKNTLYEDYSKYARDTGGRRAITKTAWGMFLGKAIPGTNWPRSFQKPLIVEGKKTRPRYYEFPTLIECRSHWDKHFGGPFDWPVEPVARSNRKDPEF